MPVTDAYLDFVRDLLADFEPLRIKRMFGGAGIYSGELFFAILADDILYLKVDDGNRAGFEERGIRPFTYETKAGRTGTMSYYPVPPEAMDDPEALNANTINKLMIFLDQAIRGTVRLNQVDSIACVSLAQSAGFRGCTARVPRIRQKPQ